jgi:hypothetical protein
MRRASSCRRPPTALAELLSRRRSCERIAEALVRWSRFEEGNSVEEELERFLKRDGRYAADWVPLQKASRKLFVRYEQIVLVSPID